MTEYLHHLPGRLRVRIPALKRNEINPQVLERVLHRRPGITSASANPLTGSVLIRYDQNRTGANRILEFLRENGWCDAPARTGVTQAAPSALATRPAEGGGAAVAAFSFLISWALQRAVEAAIERSVTAMVAALI